jgi:hypothetical protein
MLTSSNERLGVSHRRLRRLVGRAKYVLNKNRKTHPAFEAVADAMNRIFDAFISAYDKYQASEASKEADVTTGRQAIERLLGTLRAWLAVVTRQVTLDTTRFRLNTQVPDDVIAGGRLLIAVIEEAVQGGTELPYAQTALEALHADVVEAEAEWHHARTAITDRQDAAAVVRKAAADAQTQLVALRQMLLATVGRSDLDYQTLRYSRGGSTEETEAEDTAEPVEGEQAKAADQAPELAPVAVAS